MIGPSFIGLGVLAQVVVVVAAWEEDYHESYWLSRLPFWRIYARRLAHTPECQNLLSLGESFSCSVRAYLSYLTRG